MYTVLCAFEDRLAAMRSITRMVEGGLPRDDIHIQPEPGSYVELEPRPMGSVGAKGFMPRLLQFVSRIERSGGPPGAEGNYRDAVRRGSTVVVIHVADAEEALEAATLMTDLGAFDVEHCRIRWKAQK